MLESNLNINIIFLTLKIEDILIERGLTVVQIGDELLDSTLVEELDFLLLLRSVFFFLLLSLVCLFKYFLGILFFSFFPVLLGALIWAFSLSASIFSSTRSSFKIIRRPFVRKAISRSLIFKTSNSNTVVSVNMVSSGMKVTFVPVCSTGQVPISFKG